MLAFTVDTSDGESIREMVAAAAGALGGIEILVNAAARPGGQAPPPKFDELTAETFFEEMNTKVLGYLRVVQQVAPFMKAAGWGRIINISGMAARQAGTIIGSMRNVAVSAMTKNLADQLGEFGINVTVVHPGTTRTEATTPEVEARPPGNAINRLVDAADVANVVAFLASPKSLAISGDAIAAGGGALPRHPLLRTPTARGETALDEVSSETAALARHIAEAAERELPAEVAERGRMHFLDSLASAVSGRRLEAGRRGLAWLEATFPGDGPASVLGTLRSAAPFAAAVANAMAAHADETDDSHQASLSHPGCSVLPAALAAAEAAGASGKVLLRAFVCGYDVAARIGAATRSSEQHRDSGRWASHPVVGTFAASAAAAAASGLDEAQCRHLLSYACDLASGVTTWVRDTHHVEKAFVFAGMPAGNALLATSLIASGCDGIEDPFSSSPNWLEAARPDADRGALSAGLGSHFGVMGATVKKYAVGSPSQAAVEAMVTLIGRGLVAEQVEEIAVHLAPEGAVVVDNRAMPNVNAQYLLAGTLADGRFSMVMAHDEERLASAPVRALMARIRLVGDESLPRQPRRDAARPAPRRERARGERAHRAGDPRRPDVLRGGRREGGRPPRRGPR